MSPSPSPSPSPSIPAAAGGPAPFGSFVTAVSDEPQTANGHLTLRNQTYNAGCQEYFLNKDEAKALKKIQEKESKGQTLSAEDSDAKQELEGKHDARLDEFIGACVQGDSNAIQLSLTEMPRPLFNQIKEKLEKEKGYVLRFDKGVPALTGAGNGETLVAVFAKPEIQATLLASGDTQRGYPSIAPGKGSVYGTLLLTGESITPQRLHAVAIHADSNTDARRVEEFGAAIASCRRPGETLLSIGGDGNHGRIPQAALGEKNAEGKYSQPSEDTIARVANQSMVGEFLQQRGFELAFPSQATYDKKGGSFGKVASGMSRVRRGSVANYGSLDGFAVRNGASSQKGVKTPGGSEVSSRSGASSRAAEPNVLVWKGKKDHLPCGFTETYDAVASKELGKLHQAIAEIGKLSKSDVKSEEAFKGIINGLSLGNLKDLKSALNEARQQAKQDAGKAKEGRHPLFEICRETGENRVAFMRDRYVSHGTTKTYAAAMKMIDARIDQFYNHSYRVAPAGIGHGSVSQVKTLKTQDQLQAEGLPLPLKEVVRQQPEMSMQTPQQPERVKFQGIDVGLEWQTGADGTRRLAPVDRVDPTQFASFYGQRDNSDPAPDPN